MADETAVPLLGLSKGPTEYPIGTHAYAERIDDSHANAKRTWREMGEPEYLSGAEVEHLQEASRVWQEPLSCEYVNESLYLDISLPPHAVAAVTVGFAPEGADGGARA